MGRPPARSPGGIRPAAGGARSRSRPAVSTHRHGHLGRRSRGPGGQQRRQAAGAGLPRRSEPPARGPGALGAPDGILRSPGGRTVQPPRPTPRMRRPVPPLPLPSPPPGAALKARTPDPGIFLSAQRGDEARPPRFTRPSAATSSRTISCAPARSGGQNPPTPTPTLPSPGCWAPARWSGWAPNLCLRVIASQRSRAPRNPSHSPAENPETPPPPTPTKPHSQLCPELLRLLCVPLTAPPREQPG